MALTPTIFVINLPHRTDRRSAMTAQLSRIGWRARFFPAIRPKDSAGFPSIGARGCFLSHLAVLQEACNSGAEQLVILEDDVNFVAGFAEFWSSSVTALQAKTWSIFYPGHPLRPLPAGLSRIPADTGVQCSHFMMINGHALRLLIVGLESILSRPPGHPLGGPMHVDGAYSTLRAQNHALVTYACSPTLGYQRPSRTDIGKLKWFDRMAIFAPMVELARKLKAKS